MGGEVTAAFARLKAHIGEKALARLRRGGVLNVWRRSSPHNWWIEDGRGEMLWHSGGWGDRPPLSFFEERGRSSCLIDHSPVHREGGMAESAEYVLRREYLYPSKQSRGAV